ncbi:hypothetical protein AXG93_2958s1290 [Marchantia polymorpha subsp. ruderalis]|uniref:Uncharacterized protein n=1 Tax=Marchantia polymorpha subsp. ruderalis TaxID=1480154 RepID=A0A176VH49_MARPO|nr:hypothetical protein AXG93_2958s1290 [Marchantia polymorpha subsp. ruderalis]
MEWDAQPDPPMGIASDSIVEVSLESEESSIPPGETDLQTKAESVLEIVRLLLGRSDSMRRAILSSHFSSQGLSCGGWVRP